MSDYTDTDHADPITLAMERASLAAEAVAAGPARIAEAYAALETATRTYTRAYGVLAALDAVGDAPRPSSLPGVRAVEAMAPKRRRSRAKAAKA